MNLGVFHEEEEEKEEELEEDSEDEESDDEDGQVEESSNAMGEQCDGYQVSPSLRKPGLPKEVEGVIRSSNQDDTDGTSSIVLPCPSS